MIKTSLHSKMQISSIIKQVRVAIKLPRVIHSLIFGNEASISITGEIHAKTVFKEYYMKVFRLGGYAVITKDTTIQYNPKKQATVIKLHFNLFNKEGVQQ
jgi:hypothetical protein